MSDVVEAPVRPARVRKGWDIGLTIAVAVVTVIAWFAGAGASLAGLIFFGTCGTGSCGDKLINGGVVLIVLGSLGVLASIVMLIIRRRGWWVALVTLGVVLIGWVVLNVVDVG